MKETRIDRQYKKGKARERNAKPRKKACQGEDQTNSTEMNRQRHVTPNLYAARSAFLPYSSQAMFKKNFPVWFPESASSSSARYFEHCAFAQRPQASKRCAEGQSGSESMVCMIFMISNSRRAVNRQPGYRLGDS